MNIEKDMEESLFQGLSIRDSSQQGALAGASLALSGIKKSVIIIHASSGCAWVARWMRSDHAIIQYTPVIATSLLEHEVIFGGKEKLKKTIDWVMEKWKPKQLFILNADSGSLINDPVDEIATESEKSYGIPIITLDIPHFKGLDATGVDEALSSILKRFTKKEKATSNKSINLIAPFLMGSNNWVYDLAEIKRYLEALGITVNSILTYNTDIEDVKRFNNAAVNLYLTYESLPNMEEYEKQWDIKRMGFELPLPIGIANTEEWFLKIAQQFNKEREAETFLNEEREIFRPLKFNYNSSWLQTWFSTKQAAVIGPSIWAASFSRFLYFDMDVFPAIIALYGESKESIDRARGILEDLQKYYDPVILENPLYIQLIEVIMKSNIEFAIGQTQEKSLLEGHGIPLLPLAGLYSIFGSFNFIPYPFMGYRGMLYLLTMLGRLLEDTFHEKLRWEDLRFPVEDLRFYGEKNE